MSALVCRTTAARFPPNEPIWRSPAGGLLDIDFEPRFDRVAIERRPATLWRYREAIPIDRDDAIVTFGEGLTPIVPAELGGRRIWIKQEGLFPTGSYKDRGATVLISQARRLGVRRVVEDSSGNAGAAIAAYCARAGIACDIYVPASNSRSKLAQIELYGAALHPIPGSREDTAAAVWQAAQEHYYASHSWNPFFFHGTKTFAFEIVEQLGWRAPDAVVIPTGNGTLLIGAWIGFREMRQAGVIDRLPKLYAVQAAHCAPLALSPQESSQFRPKATIAEGIAIAAPVRVEQCRQAVAETGGRIVTVSESQIIAALRETLRAGFYCEPTCAAAVAALPQVDAGGEIVVPLTGHGLKAGETLMKLLL
jgi:threonine synthase